MHTKTHTSEAFATMSDPLYVVKRDGSRDVMQYDKITQRLSALCAGLDLRFVDPALITQKVAQGVHPGISTEALDCLSAETAAAYATHHPDYMLLAGRVAASNLHKNTRAIERFSEATRRLAESDDSPLDPDYARCVARHAARLDAALAHERDLRTLDYFGFKTLESKYLLRDARGAIAERPQHMYMRIAVGIHGDDVDAALDTYELLSTQRLSHATPTMHNAGTRCGQLSSCFLTPVKDDSIQGIYRSLAETAEISRSGGGIGMSVHHVRAKGAFIRGTGGTSNGLVPMLRVFNNSMRYVDQGGGKRPGSMAVYLEPWHADVEDVLNLRRNLGAEEMRARSLFYALWIPDLFMRRLQADAHWTLFCPSRAPGLHLAHGAAFDALYERYEREGRGSRALPARDLWSLILSLQVETGMPYMLYKDACNDKSNQSHLGTIQLSNLCTEIVQFSSEDEIAVCNLASVNLAACVDAEAPEPRFDFAALHRVTRAAVRNLDRVIDVTRYPLPETQRSNARHRPMGLGVQGLADAFAMLGLPFDGREARRLNARIFETMYHAALDQSCELARVKGTYPSFEGSPVQAEGLLQMDLWARRGQWTGALPEGRGGVGTAASDAARDPALHALLDWPALRARVRAHGLRNSLLMAPMPTASTAQILGNNESTAPFLSNMYTRRVMSGDFVVVNRHLVRALVGRGLWTRATRDRIIAARGSISDIRELPADIRAVFRTAFELPTRPLLDQACDRGAYICQSQSMNVYIAEPTADTLTKLHMYGWSKGLKTGTYYVHTRAKAEAVAFTADAQGAGAEHDDDDDDVCDNCSA